MTMLSSIEFPIRGQYKEQWQRAAVPSMLSSHSCLKARVLPLHAQKYAGWEDGHSIGDMLPPDIKHHISLKVQLLRCLVCSDLVSIKPERDLCFGRYSFACLFAACKLVDCRPHWLTWAQFELLSPLVLQLTAVKAPM